MNAGHSHFRCMAYCEDGTICNRPATIVDTQRGCYVCEAHKSQKDEKPTAEGGDHAKG